MKNQDWWNRSESFSAFQGVEPSKVETEKMKAISFGLKELWQEKNGCGIREPSSELFKILTFFECTIGKENSEKLRLIMSNKFLERVAWEMGKM